IGRGVGGEKVGDLEGGGIFKKKTECLDQRAETILSIANVLKITHSVLKWALSVLPKAGDVRSSVSSRESVTRSGACIRPARDYGTSMTIAEDKTEPPLKYCLSLISVERFLAPLRRAHGRVAILRKYVFEDPPFLRVENFFFQAEDGIRDWSVTGVQTCALPI